MKKILINTLGNGNMSTLYEYANEKFPNKYKIIYKDYSNIEGKLAHTLSRIMDYTQRYDLVVSDYGTKLFSRGKESILINHGYGTKFSPGLEELNNKKIMSVNDSMRKNLNYIITMSDRDKEYYLHYESKVTTRYPEYIPYGTPRTDILFSSDNHDQIKKEFLQKHKIKNNKTVLYAPTWRDYQLDSLEIKRLIQQIKILAESIDKLGYSLIYRPHFINPVLSELSLTGIDNLSIINSSVEPNAQKVMISTDILITDYSSMYVDYLALQRPIIFCDFDRERYIKSRGLAIDLDNVVETPGFKTQSFTNIVEYIKQIEKGQDNFLINRKESLELFYKYTDGKSTERSWKFMEKLLKETGVS